MIINLTYTKLVDYYILDLALDDDTDYEIGTYDRMRLCRWAVRAPARQSVRCL